MGIHQLHEKAPSTKGTTRPLKCQLAQTVKRSIGAYVEEKARLVINVEKRDTELKNCPNKNRMQGVRMSASILAQQPLVARRDGQLRQGQVCTLMLENTPAANSEMPGTRPC